MIMRILNIFGTLVFSIFFGKPQFAKCQIDPPVSFYSLDFVSISGQSVNFETLKGKYVLIVNTASKCGYTPQFEELEKLYKLYDSKLVILGFPSNDFASQDPGSNKEIYEFCTLNYGVTFPMMEKSSVRGNGKNTVFQWLTDKNKNGWCENEPSWNFCKYLINPQGELIAFYPSKVKPMSKDITEKIK